jgi:hypothetical protein
MWKSSHLARRTWLHIREIEGCLDPLYQSFRRPCPCLSSGPPSQTLARRLESPLEARAIISHTPCPSDPHSLTARLLVRRPEQWAATPATHILRNNVALTRTSFAWPANWYCFRLAAVITTPILILP